jgi:hypothetical protein
MYYTLYALKRDATEMYFCFYCPNVSTNEDMHCTVLFETSRGLPSILLDIPSRLFLKLCKK